MYTFGRNEVETEDDGKREAETVCACEEDKASAEKSKEEEVALEELVLAAPTTLTVVEAHVIFVVIVSVDWQPGTTGGTLTEAIGTVAVVMAEALRTILFVGGIAVYAVRNT